MVVQSTGEALTGTGPDKKPAAARKAYYRTDRFSLLYPGEVAAIREAVTFEVTVPASILIDQIVRALCSPRKRTHHPPTAGLVLVRVHHVLPRE